MQVKVFERKQKIRLVEGDLGMNNLLYRSNKRLSFFGQHLYF